MKNLTIRSLPLVLIALVYIASLPTQKAAAQNETVEEKVDKMPEPQGGMSGLMSYLGGNIKYPEAAREKGIEGVVMVSFVVKKEGEISDVAIIRGIGAGCDQEAMRVVKSMPKWTPGEKDGAKVNTQMQLPIKFKL